MTNNIYPFICDITPEDIIQKCKEKYRLPRYLLAKELFVHDRTLYRALKDNEFKDINICKRLLDLIKEKEGGTSARFVKRMIEYYPELEKYKTESEIRNVVLANLLHTNISDKYQEESEDTGLSSKQFLQHCLDINKEIKTIKMVSQTGWYWFYEHGRTELLIQIAKMGIPIQVIANSESVIKEIAYSMRDPSLELHYMGINETLAKWHKYECAYDNISIRISEYPIWRKMVIVEFIDGSSEAAIREYAYGSPTDNAPPYMHISNSRDVSFPFYDNEFQYLWESAKTYTEWHKTLPKEQVMISGNYLLIHPSSLNNTDRGQSESKYSELTIEEDGTAKLKLYSQNPFYTINQTQSGEEYPYVGRIMQTRNSIFLTFFDENQRDGISITLYNPFRECSKLLGIMTVLEFSGQPLAFMCACIEHSLLSHVNLETLNKVLCNTEHDQRTALMLLDNEDIHQFYSDRIITDNSR